MSRQTLITTAICASTFFKGFAACTSVQNILIITFAIAVLEYVALALRCFISKEGTFPVFHVITVSLAFFQCALTYAIFTNLFVSVQIFVTTAVSAATLQ